MSAPLTQRSSLSTNSNNEPNTNSGFRADYRQQFISEHYNGHLHLLFTSSLSLLVIALCINALRTPTGPEWLTVPVTFVYANFAEWAGHRFVMHRPVNGLRLIYKRHSLQHHRFFTHQHMPVDGPQDFKAVLFPPLLVTFFLVAFFLPLATAAYALFGSNVALLMTATGMAYFLNYELLHFAYHMPAGHWVHKLPYFEKLKALHTAHHNLELMSHHNFNITYPIADWVMGTWKR